MVAAVIAQLVYFNRDVDPSDITYHHWRTALCIQIAQNLSIITACLPCLHPFILSVLSGHTKPDTLHLECTATKKIKRYFERSEPDFNSTSSQSSTKPMNEKQPVVDYCRPLATYGLDRSSAHLHSQHFNRFPSTNTIPAPLSSEKHQENVFMRSIEIPDSRPQSSLSFSPPTTSHGLGRNSPIPKSLCDIGVIPLAEWDTEDSSISDVGQLPEHTGSSRRPRPDSEYVFSREKVISVPEANIMYEEEKGEWRRYRPPPSSRG